MCSPVVADNNNGRVHDIWVDEGKIHVKFTSVVKDGYDQVQLMMEARAELRYVQNETSMSL